MKQRKFGIQLLTTDFNRIAITKEYRERIQPLTHSYQHNLDDHTTNVLFNLGTPEQETVSFFKEQLRILNNG